MENRVQWRLASAKAAGTLRPDRGRQLLAGGNLAVRVRRTELADQSLPEHLEPRNPQIPRKCDLTPAKLDGQGREHQPITWTAVTSVPLIDRAAPYQDTYFVPVLDSSSQFQCSCSRVYDTSYPLPPFPRPATQVISLRHEPIRRIA